MHEHDCQQLTPSFSDTDASFEEQAQQILSIAAIIPGQKVERRFSIPERKPKGEEHEEPKEPQHSSKPQFDDNDGQASKVQKQFDLINLDDSAPPPQLPAKQQKQVDQKQSDHFGDLIDFGQHDSHTPGQSKPADSGKKTKDAIGGSNQNSMGRILRQDSQTSDLDEFVDAES